MKKKIFFIKKKLGSAGLYNGLSNNHKFNWPIQYMHNRNFSYSNHFFTKKSIVKKNHTIN